MFEYYGVLHCRTIIFSCFILLGLIDLNAQQAPISKFYKPIPIENSWTKIEWPGLERGKLKLKPSKGLEVRTNEAKEIFIRPVKSDLNIFFLEFISQYGSNTLTFYRLDSSINKGTKSDLQSADSIFQFNSIANNKAYFKLTSNPDEIYVFWNNRRLSFKIMANNLIISLPNYGNDDQMNYLRIGSSIKGRVNKEKIVIFQNGNPLLNVFDKEEIFAPEIISDSSSTKAEVELEKTAAPVSEDSKPNSALSVGFYCDVYYAYYTDSIGRNDFQQFTGIAPYSKVFGLNIAELSFKYSLEKFRGSLALHMGDYVQSSWSGPYNFISEANIGIRIHKSLWIDAGIFRTQFGTEGLLPRDNICSANAVSTNYEPTFVAGLRLEYQYSKSLLLDLFLINAYNGYEENNRKKSSSMTLAYTLNDYCNFGYCNYLGDDTDAAIDTISHFRVYQNIYFNYQRNKFRLQLGTDFGLQQHSDQQQSRFFSKTFAMLGTISYTLQDPWSLYGRLDYYNDPDAINTPLQINREGILTGYSTFGITAGVQYKPFDKMYLRLEGKRLNMLSEHSIFYWKGEQKVSRFDWILNMGINF